MILDERTEFCDAEDTSQEAGTTLIGDVVDIGSAQDIGQGHPIYLVIQVGTAFDGGAATNGTTQFHLASDAAAAIATDGTQSVHWSSDVFLAATQLTAGTTFVVPLPAGDVAIGTGYERFVGILATQAVEGEDDGTINAFLTPDNHGWQSYPDATN